MHRKRFNADDELYALLYKHVPIDEARGAYQQPDNWLVAHLWFRKASAALDHGGSIGARSSGS